MVTSANSAAHPLPPRAVEHYVHGLHGPLGLIEGREAVALLSYRGLGSTYLREHRGIDPDLDRAVLKLKLVSAAHRAEVGGTTSAEQPEPVSGSAGWLTAREVARHLDVTSRAVTKAITEHRLLAQRSAGRWLIDPADLSTYRPRKRQR